jgi:hypothetical protein
MPDERKAPIEQGIGAPKESPAGRQGADERRRRAATGPEVGGTSDADSAGDEAELDAGTHDTGRRAGRFHGPGEGAD